MKWAALHRDTTDQHSLTRSCKSLDYHARVTMFPGTERTLHLSYYQNSLGDAALRAWCGDDASVLASPDASLPVRRTARALCAGGQDWYEGH